MSPRRSPHVRRHPCSRESRWRPLGLTPRTQRTADLLLYDGKHFAYNSLYLGLLATTYVLLGLHRDGARRHGRLVFGLLTFALMFQSWHEVEHVFKIVQYLTLGVNGTGGIFGQGPGGLVPMFPIQLLHFAYNTVAFVPALLAFFVLRGLALRWPSRFQPAPQ